MKLLKLRTTFCPKLQANAPLDQSTVLSEYKRQSDCPPACDPMLELIMLSHMRKRRHSPKIYNFAQRKAPHSNTPYSTSVAPRATYWGGWDLSWQDPCIAYSQHHRSGFLPTRDQWWYTVYYPPPVESVDVQGDPVLNLAGNPTYRAPPDILRAAQSSIDAQFKRAKNYYDLYLNIRRAVFNILDVNIDNAFKVTNNPMLVGWNPLMEPREMFDQITAMYGKPTPTALLLLQK